MAKAARFQDRPGSLVTSFQDGPGPDLVLGFPGPILTVFDVESHVWDIDRARDIEATRQQLSCAIPQNKCSLCYHNKERNIMRPFHKSTTHTIPMHGYDLRHLESLAAILYRAPYLSAPNKLRSDRRKLNKVSVLLA